MTDPTARGALHALAGAPLSSETYRNLAYALLSAPLGVAYVVVLTTAAGLTLGLSLTLLGPVALGCSLLVAAAVAWVDGRLTAGLLGADVDPALPAGDGATAALRAVFLGRATWGGAAYLCWRAIAGTAALVVFATGLSLAVGLLSAPLAYGGDLAVDYRVGRYAVDTLGRSLLVAGGGVAVLALVLHAGNLFGRISAAVAAELLGAAGPADAADETDSSDDPSLADDSLSTDDGARSPAADDGPSTDDGAHSPADDDAPDSSSAAEDSSGDDAAET